MVVYETQIKQLFKKMDSHNQFHDIEKKKTYKNNYNFKTHFVFYLENNHSNLVTSMDLLRDNLIQVPNLKKYKLTRVQVTETLNFVCAI